MTTRARDIMSSKPVVILPQMTSGQALEVLISNRISGAPVVNHDGRLLGVLSLYDLISGDVNYPYSRNAYESLELDALLAHEGFHVESACEGDVLDLMSRKLVTAFPDTSVQKMADDMLQEKIHRVIVIEPGTQKPLGVVTTFDILKAVSRQNALRKESLMERLPA